uniref:Uncharacterized protein n=1 Tax=Salix viminalis TaxID=40686 RepID=A0A6N2KSP6_SALVM
MLLMPSIATTRRIQLRQAACLAEQHNLPPLIQHKLHRRSTQSRLLRLLQQPSLVDHQQHYGVPGTDRRAQLSHLCFLQPTAPLFRSWYCRVTCCYKTSLSAWKFSLSLPSMRWQLP